MKNLILLIVAIFIIAMLPSCDPTFEEINTIKPNAEIIGFNPDKCVCCWGWIIRMGTDTIKTDSLPKVDQIGFNFITPMPVYIELGRKKMDCSSMQWTNPVNNKDYYAIKRLELIE